ncbi:MAG: biotin/lipoyl-binding protein [Propionicimonas sp.]
MTNPAETEAVVTSLQRRSAGAAAGGLRRRIRWLAIAGVSLATVAAIGTAWATSSSAASGRFVTATAATGTVTQSFLTTGVVSRTNNVAATFAVDGTLQQVEVAIGDTVTQGQVLATLDTTALKLALLNAETNQAQAKATLYAAQHPATSSSSSARAGASAATPSGSSAAAGAAGGANTGSTGTSGTGTSGTPTTGTGVSAADTKQLLAAMAAVNVASAAWSSSDATKPTTCDEIYAALLMANVTDPTTAGTDTAVTDASSATGASGEASTARAGTSDASSTARAGTSDASSTAGSSSSRASSADPTVDPTAAPTPTTTSDSAGVADDAATHSAATESAVPSEAAEEDPTQLAAFTVDDITVEQIKACGEARTALSTANAVLADYYNQLVTTGTIVTPDESPAATPTPSASASGPSGTSGSASSASSGSSPAASASSAASVSARAVAAASAEVLSAEQDVATAESNLENAELLAPLDGTVGALSLANGGSSSGGSVTIVGEGTAVASIEVPLATRTLLKQGMATEVTPAGASAALAGTITGISILQTPGTSGDSPTYTTVVVVKDPDQLLNAGAKASVSIAVRTASDVVVVPASAVTPTGDGAGTVQVVASAFDDTAQTIQVTTGAVGGGRVEVATGLTAGQLVVLADRTAAIPSNTTQRRTTTSAGSTAR